MTPEAFSTLSSVRVSVEPEATVSVHGHAVGLSRDITCVYEDSAISDRTCCQFKVEDVDAADKADVDEAVLSCPEHAIALE